MIIDFNKMEEKELVSFKGGEKTFLAKMFDDGTNKILHGKLNSGASIGLHTHSGNCEIIYILSGSGTIIDDGNSVKITEGQCNYCQDGHSHSLINSGNVPLIFFAVIPQQ